MYRKYVAPLSTRILLKLMKLYSKGAGQFAELNDFELCLGQLYKQGIVQIKKQLENGSFIFFISLTESGKELLKQSELSIQPVF
jgi:hypothetical protein